MGKREESHIFYILVTGQKNRIVIQSERVCIIINVNNTIPIKNLIIHEG
jgi:hypothetical protein